MDKYQRRNHDMSKSSALLPLVAQEIILEEFDFSYSKAEMNLATDMYNEGRTLREIAETVRPKLPIEYALIEASLLVIHLDWHKKLKVKNRSKDFWG